MLHQDGQPERSLRLMRLVLDAYSESEVVRKTFINFLLDHGMPSEALQELETLIQEAIDDRLMEAGYPRRAVIATVSSGANLITFAPDPDIPELATVDSRRLDPDDAGAFLADDHRKGDVLNVDLRDGYQAKVQIRLGSGGEVRLAERRRPVAAHHLDRDACLDGLEVRPGFDLRRMHDDRAVIARPLPREVAR